MKVWLLPRLASLGDALLKLLADLTATRNIIALGMLYLFAKTFLKGLALAKTSPDVVALLGAVSNVTMAAFMVWFGGKVVSLGTAPWTGIVRAASERLHLPPTTASGEPELSDEDLPTRKNRPITGDLSIQGDQPIRGDR